MKTPASISAHQVATGSASAALDVCVGVVGRVQGFLSSLFIFVAVTVLALAPAPASG